MDCAADARLWGRVIVAFLLLCTCLSLALFVPAGTVFWWQAWLCLGVFAVSVAAMALYFMRYDRNFVVRRLRAGPFFEPLRSQRVILSLSLFFGVMMLVVSGLEMRSFGLSMPFWLSLLGNLAVAASMALVFSAFHANRHAAAIVSVFEGQTVVSSGPYSIIRHPMYAGECLLFISVPFALGSYLALIPAVVLIATVILRLLDEEKFLDRNLPGYTEYKRRVRYRIIPMVF